MEKTIEMELCERDLLTKQKQCNGDIYEKVKEQMIEIAKNKYNIKGDIYYKAYWTNCGSCKIGGRGYKIEMTFETNE